MRTGRMGADGCGGRAKGARSPHVFGRGRVVLRVVAREGAIERVAARLLPVILPMICALMLRITRPVALARTRPRVVEGAGTPRGGGGGCGAGLCKALGELQAQAVVLQVAVRL
jgi:hypothetical protein